MTRRPLPAALVVAAALVVVPALMACGKKAPAVVDAGVVEEALPPSDADKADPARVKAEIASTCGEAANCKCMNERFGERYTDAAIRLRTVGDVNTTIREIREDCALRAGKLREGVLSTCSEGKENQLATCECAADAFLKTASSQDLREILDRGWDRDTTNALLFEKKNCAAKATGN